MNTTPIEFMAWDKLGKHGMCKVVGFKSLNYPKTTIRIEYIDEDGDLLTKYRNEGDYELLQLTALRSINNEPIYNHMIVKNQFNDLFEIDMFNYDLMGRLKAYFLEIVGNRFQSPELLELCK